MSTEPEPTSFSPSRASGRWAAWAITVSRWPSSRIRPSPVPARRAIRSSAWSGEEQGTRSSWASSGVSAAHTEAHSSAPWRSPEGEETATSASSSRGARRAISCEHLATQSSIRRATLPGYRLWAMPELPEMEITARRLERVAGRRDDRDRGGAGHQRAEDVRPAAERSRGREDRGRAAAREAADARRRRPDAAHAPDERGAAAAVPQARDDEGPHDARGPAAVRGPRAAAARVRDQAARVGEAAAAGGGRRPTRRSRTSGRRRGPTRPTSSRCSTRSGRCTRCCATSRW